MYFTIIRSLRKWEKIGYKDTKCYFLKAHDKSIIVIFKDMLWPG